MSVFRSLEQTYDVIRRYYGREEKPGFGLNLSPSGVELCVGQEPVGPHVQRELAELGWHKAQGNRYLLSRT